MIARSLVFFLLASTSYAFAVPESPAFTTTNKATLVKMTGGAVPASSPPDLKVRNLCIRDPTRSFCSFSLFWRVSLTQSSAADPTSTLRRCCRCWSRQGIGNILQDLQARSCFGMSHWFRCLPRHHGRWSLPWHCRSKPRTSKGRLLRKNTVLLCSST